MTEFKKVLLSNLFNAAARGDIDLTESLLSVIPNVNDAGDFMGRTALMAAAKGGHFKVVDLLLKAGADVNKQDDRGQTALIYVFASKDKNKSFREQDVKTVELLLKAGADIEHKDVLNLKAVDYAFEAGLVNMADFLVNEQPASKLLDERVIRAVQKGDKRQLRLLFTQKIDFSLLDKDGKTVLDHAVLAQNKGVIETLLTLGINPETVNKEGKTALETAQEAGLLETKAVLVSWLTDLKETRQCALNGETNTVLCEPVKIASYVSKGKTNKDLSRQKN